MGPKQKVNKKCAVGVQEHRGSARAPWECKSTVGVQEHRGSARAPWECKGDGTGCGPRATAQVAAQELRQIIKGDGTSCGPGVTAQVAAQGGDGTSCGPKA